MGHGWVNAGDLWVGAPIRHADGTISTVQGIRLETRPQVMYNLTVAGAHTFFVGAQQVLVHNSCPNPHGRLGSPAHRAVVDDVARDLTSKGYTGITRETHVPTPGGEKANRYADISGIDPTTGNREYHQVGRQTKGGLPVKRERDALDDLANATGTTPVFHIYR